VCQEVPPRRQYAGQGLIEQRCGAVEEGHTQDDHQEVEMTEVPRQVNRHHEGSDGRGRRQTGVARDEEEEGCGHLDEEQADEAEFQGPGRQAVGVPAQRTGQWHGDEEVLEVSQILAVQAEELEFAEAEHHAEEEPAVSPGHGRQRQGGGRPVG
jgi:hypothetical protein